MKTILTVGLLALAAAIVAPFYVVALGCLGAFERRGKPCRADCQCPACQANREAAAEGY